MKKPSTRKRALQSEGDRERQRARRRCVARRDLPTFASCRLFCIKGNNAAADKCSGGKHRREMRRQLNNETPGTQRWNHSVGIFISLLLLLLNCRTVNNRGREVGREVEEERRRRHRMGWINGAADRDGGMNEVDVRGEGCHRDSVNDVQMAREPPLPTPVI